MKNTSQLTFFIESGGQDLIPGEAHLSRLRIMMMTMDKVKERNAIQEWTV